MPVRVDCAELADHFSLCELFFSFRGLGENIASIVEIKNTALKIRRAGCLQVKSGVTEIGLCFTVKLNTPIFTPELQSKQGYKMRGRVVGKKLSACLMFVNGARPAWQSVCSQCGGESVWHHRGSQYGSQYGGQDKSVSILL